MIHFFDQQRNASLRRSLFVACILCIAIQSGCRKAAYTELYIEQLNNEARLLEDRIYEYDSAYRELEHEVQSLHHENERLRGQLGSAQSLRSRKSQSNLEFEEIPPGSSASPQRTTPKEKPRTERPAPAQNKTPKDSPAVIESEPLEPPAIELPSPPSMLNDSSSTDPVGTSVDYVAVSRAGNKPRPVDDQVVQAVAVSTAIEPEEEIAESEEVRDAEEQSDAKEQSDAVASDESSFPVDAEVIETQQAYAPHLSPSASTTATSSIGSDNTEDVIELMFHPAFTRAIDADKTPGEESFRMILQPKLASGKVVPVNGHLTIVVVDPNATNPDNPDAPVSLGRWTFTPEQLLQYFDPIGSANGYRFEMGPLQSKPTKSELTIFVRLEYEDGRKLVNQFTIHPDSNPTDKPIWTARAKQP